jgi:hypothetical protein
MITDTPVLDTLTVLTAAYIGHSSLGSRELMLGRTTALMRMGAPPATPPRPTSCDGLVCSPGERCAATRPRNPDVFS